MPKYPSLLERKGDGGEGGGEEEGVVEGEECEHAEGGVMDWIGRPADDRPDLGWWACASYALGCYFLVYSAYFGVVTNLVLYLVSVWGESNASAANTLTTLTGTTYLFSFAGAFAADAYVGRLWGSILFALSRFHRYADNPLFSVSISGGGKKNLVTGCHWTPMTTAESLRLKFWLGQSIRAQSLL